MRMRIINKVQHGGRAMLLAAFAISLVSWSSNASALIIHTEAAASQTTNPAAHQTTPTGGLGDPGWANVGWGGSGTSSSAAGTAVYLGDGWVLTANHTNGNGITLGTDETTGGTRYDAISDTVDNVNTFRLKNADNSNSDLRLFRVDGTPNLPVIHIAQTSPTVDSDALVVVGTGLQRGSELKTYSLGAGSSNDVDGYDWGTERHKAWGNTQASTTTALTDINGTKSHVFDMDFDENIEGAVAAADKDSGSAVFTYNSAENRWELAAIVVAVRNTFSQGGTAFSQLGNSSQDPSAIVAADLAHYQEQINAIVPEPTALSLLGTGTLLLLVRRRGARTA